MWFINPSSALSCPLNRMTHCVQISGGVETVTAFKETVLGKNEAAVLVVAVVVAVVFSVVCSVEGLLAQQQCKQ